MKFFRRKHKEHNIYSAAHLEINQKCSSVGFVGASKAIFIACAALIIVALVSTIPFVDSRAMLDTATKPDIASLAKEKLKSEDFGEAIELFEQAIKIDPADEELYIGLANSYAGVNEADKARKALVTGYNETGSDNIKTKLGELEKVDLSERFDNLIVSGKEALNNRENALALANFLDALEIDPESVETYILAAESCTDTEKAISILEKGFEKTESSKIKEYMEQLTASNSESALSSESEDGENSSESKEQITDSQAAYTVALKTYSDKNAQTHKGSVIFESTANWFKLSENDSYPALSKINSDIEKILSKYFELRPSEYGADTVEELYDYVSEYGKKIEVNILIKVTYNDNNIISYVSALNVSSPNAFSSVEYHTVNIKTGDELMLGDILSGDENNIKKSVSDAYSEAGIELSEDEYDNIRFYLESGSLVFVSSAGKAYIPFTHADKFKNSLIE